MSAGTAAVRAALALAARVEPGLRDARLRAMPPSEGGANLVFRVRARGGDYFAKLRLDPYRPLDRERWALSALAGRGAPELVHAARLSDAVSSSGRYTPGGELLITRAVPGSPRSRLSEAHLAAVGQALATLHRRRPRRGPALACGATVSEVPAVLAATLRRVTAARILDAATLARLRRLVSQARRQVSESLWDFAGAPLALCHGDLRPRNLLLDDDGTARLVDFEHAGLGDPMLDLSRLVVTAELSRHEELCLLDAYAEAAGPRGLERYFTCRPLAPLIDVLGAAHHLALLATGRLQAPRGFVRRRAVLLSHRLERVLGAPARVSLAEAA